MNSLIKKIEMLKPTKKDLKNLISMKILIEEYCIKNFGSACCPPEGGLNKGLSNNIKYYIKNNNFWLEKQVLFLHDKVQKFKLNFCPLKDGVK